MEIDNIGLVGLILMVAGYLIPSFIASYRNHHNVMSITVLNLFLGWTVLGWIGALVWCFSSQNKN